MVDEGGQPSCKGDSRVSSDGKTDGLHFAGPTTSVRSEGLDRLVPGDVGLLAEMSCSVAAGEDCATIVVLYARVDPVETDVTGEREGVFGMGCPPGAILFPELTNFFGDSGVGVDFCTETDVPRECEGVFGMGCPPGAIPFPELTDFFGGSGVGV